MPTITKDYKVKIPKKVRKDLNIQQGDEVVFVKNKDKNWVLMTLDGLTEKIVERSSDIEETITESREGFRKGSLKNLKSLDNR